jgi:peptide-methionine (S)-S-oxide reductase
MNNKVTRLPDADQVLPGRDTLMQVNNKHFVNNNPVCEPFPEHLSKAVYGLGCFWGAEKKFWELTGVYSTAVGYAGGFTPNPSYQEVCSGKTGHNEVVLVVYDEKIISYENLLKTFWQSHNPTQGMRQGNDIGTQYRSGIYTYNEQQQSIAQGTQMVFQKAIQQAPETEKLIITTEILPVQVFYYAEDYHQQYLAKNPGGYCGHGGLVVAYPDQAPG